MVMKNKLLVFTLVFIGLLSNALPAKSLFIKEKDKRAIIYESTANGVAEIKLTLKPNHKFKFYMRIVPQPMTTEKESIVKASGKWSQDGKWTQLFFKGKKIDLNALFDKNFANKNEFRNSDKQSIELNNQLDVITIWGVPCAKHME